MFENGYDAYDGHGQGICTSELPAYREGCLN